MNTPYGFAYSLLGFEGLMLLQKEDPRLLQQVLDRSLQRAKELVSALAASGIDGIYFQETLSSADTISPAAFERFSLRYNQPLFEHVTSAGLFSILYYAGHSLPRLRALTQLKLSAIAVEESKKGFKVPLEAVIKEVAGRAAVFGNVDVVNPQGPSASPEAIRREVRRQAELGKQARTFVSSTGSPFLAGTDPGIIEAVIDASHGLPAA